MTLPAKTRYDVGRPFDMTEVPPTPSTPGVTPTPNMTGVTLMTSLASPQPTGTMITLTATGSGGATPVHAFRFWVQPYGGAWQIVRDWGPAATYVWTPTMASGFNVAVEARGSGKTVAEVQTAVGFVITAGSGGSGGTGATGAIGGGGPMTGVSLMTNLTNPQPTGTMITLSATGSGGATPYAYRFWVQPWSGGWQIVRDWGPEANYVWTAAVVGGHNLAVEARSAGATAVEVQSAIGFVITAGSGGSGGGGGRRRGWRTDERRDVDDGSSEPATDRYDDHADCDGQRGVRHRTRIASGCNRGAARGRLFATGDRPRPTSGPPPLSAAIT